jgi:hypothetical protein
MASSGFLRPDRGDAVAFDCNCLCDPVGGIDGDDLAPANDEIGGLEEEGE